VLNLLLKLPRSFSKTAGVGSKDRYCRNAEGRREERGERGERREKGRVRRCDSGTVYILFLPSPLSRLSPLSPPSFGV